MTTTKYYRLTKNVANPAHDGRRQYGIERLRELWAGSALAVTWEEKTFTDPDDDRGITIDTVRGVEVIHEGDTIGVLSNAKVTGAIHRLIDAGDGIEEIGEEGLTPSDFVAIETDGSDLIARHVLQRAIASGFISRREVQKITADLAEEDRVDAQDAVANLTIS